MPGLKERAKTLLELIDGARFLVASRPLELDDKARKILDDDARGVLKALSPRFSELSDWTAEALEQEVRKYAEEAELKLGKVAQPLRGALTGRGVSPPVFDVMAVLGREEVLARLADQAG